MSGFDSGFRPDARFALLVLSYYFPVALLFHFPAIFPRLPPPPPASAELFIHRSARGSISVLSFLRIISRSLLESTRSSLACFSELLAMFHAAGTAKNALVNAGSLIFPAEDRCGVEITFCREETSKKRTND